MNRFTPVGLVVDVLYDISRAMRRLRLAEKRLKKQIAAERRQVSKGKQ